MQIQETTALDTGYWKTSEQLDAQWQIESTFEPRIGRDQAAQLLAGWHKAVERSKRWAE